MTDDLQLTLRRGADLMLDVTADGSVLVPMDPAEREICRAALNDALLLLAQTVVAPIASDMGKAPTPSWAVIKGNRA